MYYYFGDQGSINPAPETALATFLLTTTYLISSGVVVTGFSMATRQRICSRWFCITSLYSWLCLVRIERKKTHGLFCTISPNHQLYSTVYCTADPDPGRSSGCHRIRIHNTLDLSITHLKIIPPQPPPPRKPPWFPWQLHRRTSLSASPGIPHTCRAWRFLRSVQQPVSSAMLPPPSPFGRGR